MNVNITGIHDNTVIVETNLFEDVRLLQTGLSDTLFSVVGGLVPQSTICKLNNIFNIIG